MDSFYETSPHIIVPVRPKGPSRLSYNCPSLQGLIKKGSKSPHKDLYHKMIEDEKRIYDRRNRLRRLVPPALVKRAHSWHGLLKRKSSIVHDDETLALLEKATAAATTESTTSPAQSETCSVDLEVRMPPKRTNTSPGENTLEMEGREQRGPEIIELETYASTTSSIDSDHKTTYIDSDHTTDTDHQRPLIKWRLPHLPRGPVSCKKCYFARQINNYPEYADEARPLIRFRTFMDDDETGLDVAPGSLSSSSEAEEESDFSGDAASSTKSRPTSFLSMARTPVVPTTIETAVDLSATTCCGESLIACEHGDADDERGNEEPLRRRPGRWLAMPDGTRKRVFDHLMMMPDERLV
ncbi:MAG: hypothetical protein Q9220_004826 [cf. Caloplaca sp. 1 TL-2023]